VNAPYDKGRQFPIAATLNICLPNMQCVPTGSTDRLPTIPVMGKSKKRHFCADFIAQAHSHLPQLTKLQAQSIKITNPILQ
jgi:hypothetical protein